MHLTPDAETHPNIVEVSSMISDIMMKYVDNLSIPAGLGEEAGTRRRAHTGYFMEANGMQSHVMEPTLLSQVNGILSASSG